jgi:hypothetical protein
MVTGLGVCSSVKCAKYTSGPSEQYPKVGMRLRKRAHSPLHAARPAASRRHFAPAYGHHLAEPLVAGFVVTEFAEA